MRYAIISDIHGHLEALQTVLRDATSRDVQQVLCLGDIGADPCVGLVRVNRAEGVFGNWETSNWRGLSAQNRQWVLNLPPMRRYHHFWVSHAAPGWSPSITTLRSYLTLKSLGDSRKNFPYFTSASPALWNAFYELLSANIPLLLHGHTHQQVVWALDDDNQLEKSTPRTLKLAPKTTYVVGVGSVGLPKDSALPSYALLDTQMRTLEFLRVTPTPAR